MIRAQCIVKKNNRLLLVQHRQDGHSWWCLPGGGVEQGETPSAAALRELQEECGMKAVIIRQTSYILHAAGNETYTYLVDIGDQIPQMGADPEFPEDDQILVGMEWLSLDQIPERDRAFLWAAGLLDVPEFLDEVELWGDDVSYPGIVQR